MKLLVIAGANVNFRNPSWDNNTPAHVAAFHGHGPIMLLLLAGGADLTIKNKAGKTAAELAITLGHMVCCNTISQWNSQVKTGAKLPAIADIDASGKTGLFQEAEKATYVERRASVAEETNAKLQDELAAMKARLASLERTETKASLAPPPMPPAELLRAPMLALPPPPARVPAASPQASPSAKAAAAGADESSSPIICEGAASLAAQLQSRRATLRAMPAARSPQQVGTRQIPYKSPTPIAILSEIKSGVNLRPVDRTRVAANMKARGRFNTAGVPDAALLNDLRRTLRSKRRHMRNDSAMSEDFEKSPLRDSFSPTKPQQTPMAPAATPAGAALPEEGESPALGPAGVSSELVAAMAAVTIEEGENVAPPSLLA